MFYAREFWFSPYEKVLEGVDDARKGQGFEDAAVIFYQGESQDQENRSGVLKKFLKNVKWFARKFGTEKVVLHSFNHLSSSKAEPLFVQALVGEVEERLKNVGFSVAKTPYGYLNEWKIHVPGQSLARVFKEF